MLILYDSLTGNCRSFAYKLATRLGLIALPLNSPHNEKTPLILITYTIKKGEIPSSTQNFLDQNAYRVQGVVVSGSYHWGSTFCAAADRIQQAYHLPILARINKSGTIKDLDRVENALKEKI